MLLAGRYRLLSVVGMGGMGTVWRAYDDLLEREVAVKEVALPQSLSDGERAALRRRVVHEARTTALLDHPGVVTVHDVVEQDERPWIVMELIHGSSLKEILETEGPLPPRRAAGIGRWLLSVLTAAHLAGLLHRDVKPNNVLVTTTGRVVLTDFGLAVSTSGTTEGRHPLEGSPAYISPEQALGRPLSPASDLWSLGALLYATVEGRPPYEREGALPSLLAILMDPYVPPAHAGPLRPVIDGLLRRDPADRLEEAEVAGMLSAVAAQYGPRRRRRLAPAATVTALAVIVAIGGAWAARWTDVGTSDTMLVKHAGAAAGTITYRDPAGYSVDLPLGWTRIAHPDGVYWHDPAGPRYIRVARVAGDPLTGLQSAERDAHLPAYQRLRLERNDNLIGGGAQWEFTWNTAVAMRALETRADGFDVLVAAPDADWTPSQHTFDGVLSSFHPYVA
jgi:hypothetical protein